ncbi:MAG TPA: hypothetical protein DEF51_38320 [Myxococcales bacterium]|nr:hypothetical protein [Myxococcales bacterium]
MSPASAPRGISSRAPFVSESVPPASPTVTRASSVPLADTGPAGSGGASSSGPPVVSPTSCAPPHPSASALANPTPTHLFGIMFIPLCAEE